MQGLFCLFACFLEETEPRKRKYSHSLLFLCTEHDTLSTEDSILLGAVYPEDTAYDLHYIYCSRQYTSILAITYMICYLIYTAHSRSYATYTEVRYFANAI